MKIKSVLIAMLYSSAVLFALSQCSSKKEETSQDEQHDESMHASSEDKELQASAPQFQVEAAFQQQLSAVFTAYVSLKDALVASDAAKVKAEAANVLASLASVDMKLLTGAAHNDWMNYVGTLESSLKEIQSTDDLEAQRLSFSKTSDNLYKSIKAYGLGGTTAFYEYCPMAFNNTGGYWLSNVSEIRNPYFGDKMLKCGAVKEKLQ